MKLSNLCLAFLFLFNSLSFASTLSESNRIISIGGDVTEIVYALKQEGRLIGTDSSSSYPPEAQKLPQIGFFRDIPTESIISLNPSTIIASEHTGPKEALERIKNLGIQVYTVADNASTDDLYIRIKQVAEALDVKEEGQKLLSKIKNDIESAKQLPSTPLRTTLLFYSSGKLLVAGKGTHPNEILKLAGVVNIFDDVRGPAPVSAESMIERQPELIIIPKYSVETNGGLDIIKALPAIAHSPAVKNNRILVIDDLLILGIGLRTGEAIRQIKAMTQ